MPLVREVLKNSTQTLETAGVQTPRLDVEILLAHVLGTSRENLLTRWDENLSPGTLEKFESLIERRKGREPVARITGVQEFWSLLFKVGDATLIPRPDSETLVEAALKKIPAAPPSGATPLRRYGHRCGRLPKRGPPGGLERLRRVALPARGILGQGLDQSGIQETVEVFFDPKTRKPTAMPDDFKQRLSALIVEADTI